jgi:hypothetical protein
VQGVCARWDSFAKSKQSPIRLRRRPLWPPQPAHWLSHNTLFSVKPRTVSLPNAREFQSRYEEAVPPPRLTNTRH